MHLAPGRGVRGFLVADQNRPGLGGHRAEGSRALDEDNAGLDLESLEFRFWRVGVLGADGGARKQPADGHDYDKRELIQELLHGGETPR